MVGYSPGNKRVSRLFPNITDGAKRRHLLGTYRWWRPTVYQALLKPQM
jgi:hypothetical protein